jgi:hypothetical protein
MTGLCYARRQGKNREAPKQGKPAAKPILPSKPTIKGDSSNWELVSSIQLVRQPFSGLAQVVRDSSISGGICGGECTWYKQRPLVMQFIAFVLGLAFVSRWVTTCLAGAVRCQYGSAVPPWSRPGPRPVIVSMYKLRSRVHPYLAHSIARNTITIKLCKPLTCPSP